MAREQHREIQTALQDRASEDMMRKKAEPIVEVNKDPVIELAEKMLEEIVKMRESLDKIVKRFV